MMRRLSRWSPALAKPAAEPPASFARAMKRRLSRWLSALVRPAAEANLEFCQLASPARRAARCQARPRPSSQCRRRALLGLATKAQPWLRGPRSAAGRDYIRPGELGPIAYQYIRDV